MLQKKKIKRKIFQTRYLRIFSRHPSHSILRNKINLPILACLRLGSTTSGTIPYKVELNSVESIKISSNKLLMKRKFNYSDVKTAIWYTYDGNNMYLSGNKNSPINLNLIEFPIVTKHHYGSRGTGNNLIKTQKEFESWTKGKTLSNYIFEKYYNYGLEYRLHITEQGCFYTCRKALKQDCPEDQKWRHHDDTCVWFLEENPNFLKPNSWNDIISDCIKALKAVGADILSFDVKVQSAIDSKGRNREYQDYILLECNSASSLDGEIVSQKYIEEIPKLVKYKLNR